MNIVLPKEINVAVLGSNPALMVFVETLLRQGVPPANVTVILDRERMPADVGNLKEVQIIEVGVASDSELNAAISSTSATVCCVFGWYAILKNSFIQHFHGRVFNMHFGNLPLYRGAGGFSWQVLNGENTLGAFIHVLVPKVDAGPVVCRCVTEVVKLDPYPIDFHESAKFVANAVAEKFGRMLACSEELPVVDQDEDEAEYFPMLTTVRNGLIDFSWTCESVARFIRAFSNPYPGAIFCYKEKKFKVQRVSLLKNNIARHPWVAGLLVNKSPAGLHVIFHDGVLRFEEIRDSFGNAIDLKEFRIGERLYNTNQELLSARLFRP